MKLDHALVSRELFKTLRDVMVEGGSIESRLHKVVCLISEKLGTNVCSCYVMRGDDTLELYATKGLSSEAVHATRLHVGEGLVGLVAQNHYSVALADAWKHPKFAYRPETNEDSYHSFLGVPLVSSGKICGVLVVQDEEERIYQEEEIETLETVSMILAEMLFSGDFFAKEKKKHQDSLNKSGGVSLSSGIGMGKAVFHKKNDYVARLIAKDKTLEKQKLLEALNKMHIYLDEKLSEQKLGEGEHLEIFEAYKMFAKDEGWVKKIHSHIDNNLTAEAAVQRVYDDMWVRMSAVTDSYLKERLYDFKDLTDRLQGYLIGDVKGENHKELPDNIVIVAESLGPAELLDYDVKKVRGILLAEGTPTMHVAIVARSMNIPVLSKIEDAISSIKEFDDVIIDANHGQIFIRPSDDIREIFHKRFLAREKHKEALALLKDVPNITVDGQDFELFLNAGLVMDMDYLGVTNADGIGLYRTEIPFLIRTQMPTVEVQAQLYSSVVEKANGKPVSFRTLDVGSDKLLSYWENEKEENPAMGWRSIRITLDRRAILRQQLRAMIRATAGGELRVMFPMVAEPEEFLQAKKALEKELKKEEREGGKLPKSVKVGTMIEVPSVVFQLDSFLKYVDFVSVGTNDLMQFFFACDRGNPKLTNRYDSLSPAFLNLLKKILEKCKEAGVECSVCGEMAGNPLDALALFGLGYRKLSVSGPLYGDVKNMLRSITSYEVEGFIKSLLYSKEHSLRTTIRSFAIDHNIKI
jgi:phosphotransferase system enzyme I (PtsP)